jgi:hypothetical protein
MPNMLVMECFGFMRPPSKTFQRGKPVQAWKACSLSLLVAVFTACEDGGIIIDTECDPACKEGQVCKLGQCVIDPGWTVDPLPLQCTEDKECKQDADERCVDGVCKSECDEDNPCAEGACNDSGRCVIECDDDDPCPGGDFCVKGVCKALSCESACDRAHVCQSAGNEDDPSVGECVEVECLDGGGAYRCTSLQTCVADPNATDPLEGVCRPSCTVPATGMLICLPPTGGEEVCLGIESQTSGSAGTCEPVVCGSPCNAWTGFCAAGPPEDLTAGQCVTANCHNACTAGEFCRSTGDLRHPTAGQCEPGCITDNDCGEWETCEVGVLPPGTCIDVDLGPGHCKTDDDCLVAGETCVGADPTTLTQGTCEEDP